MSCGSKKTQQLAIPTRRARWKALQAFLPLEMAPPRPTTDRLGMLEIIQEPINGAGIFLPTSGPFEGDK